MQWIKRNLFLVVGAVVALVLLCVAGIYLLSRIQQDRAVTAELDDATQKLEALAKRDPYPNAENISAAKDETNRLAHFLDDVEKHFQPPPIPENMDSMQFRTLLDNTHQRLVVNAKRAGVEVPTNYWFTFAAQKGSMTFSTNSLQPLSTQLADVMTICQVLFDAKVNSLLWLKRAAVDSQDSAGSQDYVSTKPVTNNFFVSMPYEVAFQGFSSELASVLEGFARLPTCYMVTNLVVEPAATAGQPAADPTTSTGSDYMSRYGFAPGAQAGAGAAMRYGMANRYGMGRYGPQQPPVVPQPVAPQKTTVLEEKPLRFTLSLQSVKLKPRSK